MISPIDINYFLGFFEKQFVKLKLRLLTICLNSYKARGIRDRRLLSLEILTFLKS